MFLFNTTKQSDQEIEELSYLERLVSVEKRNRRTFCIKVESSNKIVLLSPKRASKKDIQFVLKRHKKWLDIQIEKKKKMETELQQGQFVSGRHVFLFGSTYQLQIMSGGSDAIFILGKKIVVEVDCRKVIDGKNVSDISNEEDSDILIQEHIQIRLTEWYKEMAKEFLAERTIELATRFRFKVNTIRIKSMKTRWGSCSSKNNINLCYRLIMAPKDVIDYVIIHELCHLKEMNHSHNFWRLVASICPTYVDDKNWLKVNGFKLIL